MAEALRAGEARDDVATSSATGDRAPDSPSARTLPADRAVSRWWLWAHVATLVVAAVGLAIVNRDQWFFGDEWEFLVNRGFFGANLDLLYPHNEHWSTIPIIVYTLLRDTIGLGSYWPYIGVLILVHLALAHLLWRASLRSGVPASLATAGAAVFMFLGAGHENILWAFQIGFLGSVLFGWAAVLVADHPSRRPGRRDVWTVLLLLGALMCSGVGVVAVPMVVVVVLVRTRHLLRPLIVGGVPTAVFVAWYLTVGQAARHPNTGVEGGLSARFATFRSVVVDVVEATVGVRHSVAELAIVAVGVWLLWVLARTLRRPEDPSGITAGAGLVGAAAFVIMIMSGRGDDMASRYLYVLAALVVPAALATLSVLPAALGRFTRPAVGRWAAAAMAVAALALLLPTGIRTLVRAADDEAAREAPLREAITAAAALTEDDEQFLAGNPEPVYNPDVTMRALDTFVSQKHLPDGPVTAVGLNTAYLGLEVVAVELDDGVVQTAQAGDLTPLWGAVEVRRPGMGECWGLESPDDPGAVYVVSDGEPVVVELHSDAIVNYELRVGEDDEVSTPRGVGVAPSGPRAVVADLPAGTRLTIHLPASDGLVCVPSS